MIRWILAGLLLALPAEAYELQDALVQGALVRGKAAPGSSVTLDGEAIPVTRDGRFVFGLRREAPAQVTLAVSEPGRPQRSDRLAVKPQAYKIDRVDGLPEAKVDPDPQAQVRIKEERELIVAARARRSAEEGAFQAFVWPAKGRISGVYGSQRVLNGQPRAPHFGLDIAAPEGTQIVAPAAGVVSLSHPDMFFTGRTVMLDHGQAVSTVYAHMSEILVKDGQPVAQGQPIGRIGKTGRVTGPHLHWGLFWRNVGLDPALLLPPMGQ